MSSKNSQDAYATSGYDQQQDSQSNYDDDAGDGNGAYDDIRDGRKAPPGNINDDEDEEEDEEEEEYKATPPPNPLASKKFQRQQHQTSNSNSAAATSATSTHSPYYQSAYSQNAYPVTLDASPTDGEISSSNNNSLRVKSSLDADDDRHAPGVDGSLTLEVDSVDMQHQQHGNSAFYVIFPQFQAVSVTFALVVAFTLMFLITTFILPKPRMSDLEDAYVHRFDGDEQDDDSKSLGAASDAPLDSLYDCRLFALGARYAPAYARSGLQYYRTLTSIFVHPDLVPLLVNVALLLFYGYTVETYMGSRRYALVLLASGTAAHFLSAAVYPHVLATGAQGIACALLGANVKYMAARRQYLSDLASVRWKHFACVAAMALALLYLGGTKDFWALAAAAPVAAYALTVALLSVDRKAHATAAIVFVAFLVVCALVVRQEQDLKEYPLPCKGYFYNT